MRRTTAMASAISPLFHFFILFLFSLSPHLSLGHRTIREKDGREGAGVGVRRGHRVLMGFKETPSGSNLTYQCSPSGPCVACQYSEKNDEKYRCSETGYRIPFKCVEIGTDSNDAKGEKDRSRSTLENSIANKKIHVILHNADELPTSVSQRSLLAESSTSATESRSYITYRSCITPVNEEKLSVVGFEAIIFGMLLASGSFVYFRRKRSGAVPVGAVRLPTNSRF
ncbi:hypothetical protein NMG60_11008912 [Bertholletia excelsa]